MDATARGGGTGDVIAAHPVTSADQANRLGRWQEGATVSPVVREEAHSIHSYFTACPESPDGRWVLYYRSANPDGANGELRIRHRQSGEIRTLTRIQTIVDAHGVAFQQWIAGGRRVVFHDCRAGQWVVGMVDVESGRETIVARNRLLGCASPQGNQVLWYGLHWDPQAATDIECCDVETGEVGTMLAAATVRKDLAESLERDPDFRGRSIILFFPMLSPDGERILFKIATPHGGGPHHPGASTRKWLVAYDLARARFLFRRDDWGHPCWHPNSRQIMQVGNLLIHSDDGSETSLPGFPRFWGSHPSVTHDGQLFATDVLLEFLEGRAPGSRGVMVGRMRGTDYHLIDRFDDTQGVHSWRRPHPHPAFSHDDRRLYYNVSSSRWTRLHVAEVGGSAS